MGRFTHLPTDGVLPSSSLPPHSTSSSSSVTRPTRMQQPPHQYPPYSPNSPPPLEYDSEDSRMEEDSDPDQQQRQRGRLQSGHEHRGVPERYQQHLQAADTSARAAAAMPDVDAGSSFIRPLQDDGDSEMKEAKSEEKTDQPIIRTLRPFYVHQWLDILDTQDSWLEGQVIGVDPAQPVEMAQTAASSQQQQQPQQQQIQKILVHYKGFKAKYDEWLDVSSDQTNDMRRRIALLHTHTHRPHTVEWPRPFSRVGDRIDCKDSINQWLTAVIIAVDPVHNQVQVKYENWDDKFNEWIDVESYRLQPLGRYTQAPIQPMKTRGVGGGRVLAGQHRSGAGSSSAAAGFQSAAVPMDRLAQFQATQENEIRFRRLLRDAHGWEIIDQKEDGNCLFRSVAHQVYGEPSLHHFVRQSAMAYIESEKNFFQNYIAGETFQEYIERMRHDGEWGDNLEIQAMSEIYDRPIEIYAYSHKPLKTFTSGSSSSSSTPPVLRPPPIRLSYHFASHYNSIISPSRHRESCTTLQPGVLEQAALEKVAALRRAFEAQQQAAASSSSSSSSPEIPSLVASRQTFVSDQSRLRENPLDFENAVKASLSDMDAQEAASIAAAQQQSLREHEEQQMIAASLKASEDEAMISAAAQAAAAASSPSSSAAAASSIEDQTLRQALAASLAGQTDEELQRVLRESAAAVGAVPTGLGVDDDLQRALQSSLADQFPPSVNACVGLGFPLEQCIHAWEMVGEAATLSGVSEDMVVQRMMDYLCGQ